MWRTAVPVLLALALTIGSLGATSVTVLPDEAGLPDCEGARWLDAVGPVCPSDHGWRLVFPDGRSTYVHPDPAPDDQGDGGTDGFAMGSLQAPPRPPACRGPGTYHHRLLYAHPQDVPNRSAEVEDELRRMVREANGFLDEQARTRGHRADLPFLCDGGEVKIDSVELPHDNTDASFSQVVHDLESLGYDKSNEKYWIWYDDVAEVVSAGGTANMTHDDDRRVDNPNNRGPTYAVTWGNFYASTMLHEATHAMGAVQPDAPDYYLNSGGDHCFDDRDLMCYGAKASSEFCRTWVRYDCDKDTYFDPDPEPGSYLATHWNIGWSKNRFLELTPCAPDEPVADTAPACGAPADARVFEDAEAHRVAVSPQNDSTGTVAVSGTGDAHGTVAASGTGEAHGTVVSAAGGNSSAPIAASGTGSAEDRTWSCVLETACVRGLGAFSAAGPARADWVGVSGTGNANAGVPFSVLGNCNGQRCVNASPMGTARAHWLALSGTGDANATWVAVSGDGEARGTAPVGTGQCNGQDCWQVGLHRDAEGYYLAASGEGSSEGTWITVSGTGDPTGAILTASATGHARGRVLTVSGTGPATACTPSGGIHIICNALSGTGDATADFVAMSGAGDASGWIAISVLGEADGRFAVSGCEEVRERGSTLLCQVGDAVPST